MSVSCDVTSRVVSVGVVVVVAVLRVTPARESERFSWSVGESAVEAGRFFCWRWEADARRSARLSAREGGTEDMLFPAHLLLGALL